MLKTVGVTKNMEALTTRKSKSILEVKDNFFFIIERQLKSFYSTLLLLGLKGLKRLNPIISSMFEPILLSDLKITRFRKFKNRMIFQSEIARENPIVEKKLAGNSNREKQGTLKNSSSFICGKKLIC